MPSQQKIETERLEMRIRADNKLILQQAAQIRGLSVSAFVAQVALDSAREIVQKNQQIVLGLQETLAFHELIQNPPEPNEALLRAAKRYMKRHGN
jgi:uncharacterized protein (DUF1778 family)